MIEIMFFCAFVMGLGLSLFSREGWRSLRRHWRRYWFRQRILHLRGKAVDRLYATLGQPNEKLQGSQGRLLLVWKHAKWNDLWIITATTDGRNLLLDVQLERR